MSFLLWYFKIMNIGFKSAEETPEQTRDVASMVLFASQRWEGARAQPSKNIWPPFIEMVELLFLDFCTYQSLHGAPSPQVFLGV